MAGGAASAAGSTANPRPFRLRRASSSDVTGQATCFRDNYGMLGLYTIEARMYVATIVAAQAVIVMSTNLPHSGRRMIRITNTASMAATVTPRTA